MKDYVIAICLGNVFLKYRTPVKYSENEMLTLWPHVKSYVFFKEAPSSNINLTPVSELDLVLSDL